MLEEKEEILIEICNRCGKDVSFGSGLFINRVPDFNDIMTRFDNDWMFPIGDFVCVICDTPKEEPLNE